MTMDVDAHIWGSFGNIRVIDAPLHLYRSVVMEAATEGVIRELHRRRPYLSPAQGIDWTLTRPLWKSAAADIATAPSKRHMLAFAAGGHWKQHRLKEAGASDTDICILCGQGRDDDGHLWGCAALQHVRARHPMVTKCSEHLPVQLRHHGIAPHISTDPEQTFWGKWETVRNTIYAKAAGGRTINAA